MAIDGDLGGVRLMASDAQRAVGDARIAFLVADEAYEGLLESVFGVPRQQQTFLVKLLITGAVGSMVGEFVSHVPRLRLSRTGIAMGASAVDIALRGIGGASTHEMPAAGVLIGFALLVR